MSRLVALLAAGLVLTACSSGPAKTAAIEVSVSVSACGAGWSGGDPGPTTFLLHDVDSRAGDVDLVDATDGAVYAEVEPLAPGTTTTLHADLGSGRYVFRCAMEDEPEVTGPTVTLSGHVKGTTPAVRPVSQGDLVDATKSYQDYVMSALPGLLRSAQRLAADIDAGWLETARRDWQPAQLAYLRLGAAYDAFGELDAQIDERADGLPHGVHDASWRGLHRIEYGLWHGQSARELAPLGADLVAAVRGLRREFPHAEIAPLDISIRAHEITEDALEFALTGRDDYGSNSALAAVAADLEGTRTVLGMIRSLLASRYPALPALDAWLTRTQDDVAAAGGQPLSALSRASRDRIDSDVSELAELLAPVASILEPRRTS